MSNVITPSISDYIFEKYNISIKAGKKGECPHCGKATLQLKLDDTLGKCFHPECGKPITPRSSDYFPHPLSAILKELYNESKNYLLQNPDNSPYQYLNKKRKIHNEVIAQSPIGCIPPLMDISTCFEFQKKIIKDEILALPNKASNGSDFIDGSDTKLSPEDKKRASLERQLLMLKKEQVKLVDMVQKNQGNIAFFYTDDGGDFLSIRFRVPFSKKLYSYKPFSKSGVFNNMLFGAEDKIFDNKFIVVEGEFNILSLQSLMVRTQNDYVHSCAVGSVNGADYETISKISPKVLFIYDNDSAGKKLYKNYSKFYHCEATTTIKTKGVIPKNAFLKILPYEPLWDELVSSGYLNENGRIDDDKLTEAKNNSELIISDQFKIHTKIIISELGKYSASDLDSLILENKNQTVALKKVMNLYSLRVKHFMDYDRVREKIKIARSTPVKLVPVFEQKARVSKLIIEDLSSRGSFYKTPFACYYFSEENKYLYSIDDKKNKHLMVLLRKYNLNASEDLFTYVLYEIFVHTLSYGKDTEIYQDYFYDNEKYIIYAYDFDSNVYKVTKGKIEKVPNGTDEILFFHEPNCDPYEILDSKELEGEEDINKSFTEFILKKINFEEEGTLNKEEKIFLFQIWILSLFFESIMPTKIIACLLGPKGSGKSVALRFLGKLLFGKTFEVSDTSKNFKSENFDVTVTNKYYAVLDNVDEQNDWMNDKLASYATGSSFQKRVLFTTNDLAEFYPRCFLGITSRTPHFRRDDVAERLLLFHLELRPRKKQESSLKSHLMKHRNKMLTSLFTTLQAVLGALEEKQDQSYDGPFRMADFADFLTKISSVFGYEEEDANILLEKMSLLQSGFTLENEPVFETIQKMLEVKVNIGRKFASTSDLYEFLQSMAISYNIPFHFKNCNSFGKKMMNLKSNIEKYYNVETELGTGNVRYWIFTLKEEVIEAPLSLD